MGWIVLAVALVSLFIPNAALWIDTAWVNYLLMVVMFGMGLTIRPSDFALVFTRPRDVIIGSVTQFAIMPLIAFVLCQLFKLDPALSAGVVLVGTCPGGTASNVITYLAKGDVALSVGMTSINTLLAPILTPALTYLFLHTTVAVDVLAVFWGVVQVVLVPITLGLLINSFFWSFTQKLIRFLPMLSTVAICMIIATIVAHNAQKILECGTIVCVVVILHNLLGFLFGFCVARICRMPPAKIKALSIEVGMQNSGLAASLAGSAFPTLAMATVPGALFSVWHNISGTILASIYQKYLTPSQSIQHDSTR